MQVMHVHHNFWPHTVELGTICKNKGELAKDHRTKELFNLRHAQLRNHIERTIGILKMRFQMLKAATLYPLDKQIDISVACCVLHNFIRLHDGDMAWLRNAPLDIDPLQVVDVPDGEIGRAHV